MKKSVMITTNAYGDFIVYDNEADGAIDYGILSPELTKEMTSLEEVLIWCTKNNYVPNEVLGAVCSDWSPEKGLLCLGFETKGY